MSFVNYSHLRLLISGQMFEIAVVLEFFGILRGTKQGPAIQSLTPNGAWARPFSYELCIEQMNDWEARSAA